MAGKIAIDVKEVTVRYNMQLEKKSSMKEYFIKLLKKQLMFQEFIALEDVSFQVKRGESWGVIGKNGAGKSTLLKLICRILTPYKGTVRINGEIAPMIELGAGFDGSLTMRENIFLNGAILGQSRKDVEEKFDEIVEFSELGGFINMPLKNFSSGMRARLGFAVATCIDPDILVVDEVLAVGDKDFKKKSRERMEELISGGTTLLLVSHSIADVKELCDHALWLDHGKVVMQGDAITVCDAYDPESTKES